MGIRGRAVLAAAVTPVMVLGLATAASADDGKAYAAGNRARTEYFDKGDMIMVADLDGDGHGAVGWIEVRQSDGSWKKFPKIYDGGGHDTYVLVQQDVLREGARIKIVSCLQDGRDGRPWNCGFWYANG